MKYAAILLPCFGPLDIQKLQVIQSAALRSIFRKHFDPKTQRHTRLEDLNALHNLPSMKKRLTELASRYIESNMTSNNKMLIQSVNEFLQHNSKFRPIAPSLFTTIKDSLATHALGQANFS